MLSIMAEIQAFERNIFKEERIGIVNIPIMERDLLVL